MIGVKLMVPANPSSKAAWQKIQTETPPPFDRHQNPKEAGAEIFCQARLCVLSSSSRRTPGPITTGVGSHAKLLRQLSQNRDRWLWVPAQGRDDYCRESPYSAAICRGAGGGLTRSAASCA